MGPLSRSTGSVESAGISLTPVWSWTGNGLPAWLVRRPVGSVVKSGGWDYEKWGEPVSQKYTTGAACVLAMGNLGIDVSKDDAYGFICAWRHYVGHYLGTPDKWLLPKDPDEVERLWNQERDKELQKSDDGVFMPKQAVEYYKKFLPGPSHDAFIAMVRTALTDKYADIAGLPQGVLDLAAKPLAAGNKVVSGLGGGLFGGAAEETVGVTPYKEILGVASSEFRGMKHYAVTHDQDGQPQMHEELGDDR
ncbi:oxygenase MpaB family protein [Streptomyces atratus]|nr:oxygenase MpaB family protein [Streptomyces atratus]